MSRIVCFSFLIVHCLGSKTKNDLRIPSVSELDTSPGSLGNIGNNAPTNIGSFGSSNLGGINGFGALGSLGNGGSGLDDKKLWMDAFLDGTSVGNIAGINQTNVPGAGNVGIIGDINQIYWPALLNNLNNLNNNNNNNYKNNDDLDEEKKYIERPCYVYDKFCIRKFFAEHSHCKKCEGSVPDPIFRSQSTTYLPRINLTVIGNDILYSGLNGRIDEFYINKKTDKLVLSVEFNDLTFYSKNTYYRFYRRGKEPIVTRDYIYINYKSVITTIIIPNLKDLQLENSEVFVYVNLLPIFSIGPNASNSADPIVQQTLLELLGDGSTNVQEAMLTEGPYYMKTYVQFSICDFGYKEV